jgi:hypothetical protein
MDSEARLEQAKQDYCKAQMMVYNFQRRLRENPELENVVAFTRVYQKMQEVYNLLHSEIMVMPMTLLAEENKIPNP